MSMMYGKYLFTEETYSSAVEGRGPKNLLYMCAISVSQKKHLSEDKLIEKGKKKIRKKKTTCSKTLSYLYQGSNCDQQSTSALRRGGQ